jgi:hypothetical protein
LVFFQQVQTALQLGIGELKLFQYLPVLLEQVAAFQRTAHGVLQHFHLDQGLEQVIHGAVAQGRDHVIHAALARHHDHGGFRRFAVDGLEHIKTIDQRHAQIANHQIRFDIAEKGQPFVTATGSVDRKTTVTEIDSKTFAYHGLVIDNENMVLDGF